MDQEKLWQLAMQVPALSVLGLIVFLFLRSMERRDAQVMASLERRDKLYDERARECHSESALSRSAIERNTGALARFDEATDDNGSLVSAMRTVVREELAAHSA